MSHSGGTLPTACGGRLERARNHFVQFNRFLRTPWYVLIVAVFTALSSLYEWDLALYSFFMGFGIYLSFLGEDYLPMVPIAVMGYVSPSRENNPGRYPDSIFYPENGGILLICLAVLLIAGMIFRLSTDAQLGGKQFFTQKRKLTGSMVVLGVAYLLSGIGSEGYRDVLPNNLVFALLQFAAIIVMYFFFTAAIRWDRVPKGYLAWCGLAVGCVVLVQLIENYTSGRIFVGTSIKRELLATGWGMHNNIGCMMAMMMPFGFYLAAGKKFGWLFNLVGTGLLLGTMLSCSRTSMFVAALAYLICGVLLLKNPVTRRVNWWVYLLASAVGILILMFLREEIMSVFDRFFAQLGETSQRDKLLHYGYEEYQSSPVFGTSFYPQLTEYEIWDWAELESFSSFFPPRWHSTIIQLAASCGTVGLVAYAFHRFKTLQLFWKRRSRENTFIGISLAVMLTAGLLDCHFFNVGPVLFYSVALAFVEKMPTDTDKIPSIEGEKTA